MICAKCCTSHDRSWENMRYQLPAHDLRRQLLCRQQWMPSEEVYKKLEADFRAQLGMPAISSGPAGVQARG